MKNSLSFSIIFSNLLFNLVTSNSGYLNQNCNSNNDCGDFGYICSTNRTCQCARWYIPNKTREKCIAGIGQKCKYDEHCIDGAFCELQAECKCKDSLYSDDNGLMCSRAPRMVISGLPIFTSLVIVKFRDSFN